MKQAVLDNFIAFSTHFEGRTSWMYLDTHDPPLVTTGIGNLIDPVSLALELPWKHPNGLPATQSEIYEEWGRVKNAVDHAHGPLSWWKINAKLGLDSVDIDALVLSKAREFERILARRFPSWDNWPAPAQLATLSLSWAMGPGFHFPKWEAFAQVENWTGCYLECWIPDRNNPGLTPRNFANQKLFLQAATATDPEALFLNLKGKT